MRKNDNENQIINKYGLNGTMLMIGNMNPKDLMEGSNLEYKDDIQDVFKANNCMLDDKSEELAVDLLYLGMIYAYRQNERR